MGSYWVPTVAETLEVEGTVTVELEGVALVEEAEIQT